MSLLAHSTPRLIAQGLTALLLAGLAAPLATARPAQTQIERLREACLATDMQREPFERLIGARGLAPLIGVLRPGEDPTLKDWMTGYDDGGIQIVMSGEPADRSNATDCGVLTPRPEGDWRGEVEALALELHMQPATADGLANALESRSWTGDDGLTLSYEVYRQAVVVRFARPSTASR